MVRGILSTSACQDCVNNDHQIVNLSIPRLSPSPFCFLDRHSLLDLYRDCQNIYQPRFWFRNSLENDNSRRRNRKTEAWRNLDRSLLADAPVRRTNIFLAQQQKNAQRTAHNVHPPGSLNEDTFRSHDDADSGLFSLFNYPASPPSSFATSARHQCLRHRLLSFARGQGRKSGARRDNELSSRTRFLGQEPEISPDDNGDISQEPLHSLLLSICFNTPTSEPIRFYLLSLKSDKDFWRKFNLEETFLKRTSRIKSNLS